MTPSPEKVEAADWVIYNGKTHSYDTPDGTSVPAELVDSAACIADIINIAMIRDRQRAAIRKNRENE